MKDLRALVQLLQIRKWVTSAEIRTLFGCIDEEAERIASILVNRGLPLLHDERKGYSLRYPISLIDKERLIGLLTSAQLISATRLSVLDEVDSTNNRLLSSEDIETLHGRVCIAEYQSSGRGRHGRSWIAAGYQNLLFSLAWHMQEPTDNFSNVSLVVGLSICLCLDEIVEQDIKLKWPNDIICTYGKLGGILVEIRQTDLGGFYAVIGVGINIKCPLNILPDQSIIGQPIAELSEMTKQPCDRTEIFVKLLTSIYKGLEELASYGFVNFVEKWNDRDAYIGRTVAAKIGVKGIYGKGFGIDDSGAYQVVDSSGHVHRLISGELQLRQEVSRT